jgi:protein TonB
MMRLWVESYSKSTPVSSGAVVSVLTHAVLIGAAVVSTNRPATVNPDWIENRVYYLPPPNRVPTQAGSVETIKYVELAPEGTGAGFGPSGNLAAVDPPHESSPTTGDLGRDTTSTAPAPSLAGADSVFSQLEVDSTVTRYPGSAAPVYPVEMLKQGVQGSVMTQYVVDTTGFADTSSLKVLRSTHEDFTAAVRAALPYMRFYPAKVGTKRVRQLVEQEFTFKIQQAETEAMPATQASAKKPIEKPAETQQRNPRG